MNIRNITLAALLSTVSVAGALYLLGVQFSDGGAYPEYSSLRADPLGAKVLFDTLALVPGTKLTRNYRPLEYLATSDATVILLNVKPDAWTAEFVTEVQKIAARGNRVLATTSEVTAQPANTGALAKVLQVTFGFEPHSPRDFRLFFSASPGWKIISHEGSKAMAIERAAGAGSIVLFADSSGFANASLVDDTGAAATDRFPIISTAIGQSPHVVFDEQHLGIAQTGSVAGLLRRFRLTGMLTGLAVCAVLFIWRKASAFPPPASVPEIAITTGRTSRSGLLTLLRRHVPKTELAAVCWNEWLSSNRRAVPPEGAARAAEVIRNTADDPVKAMREIQSIVNSKGKL